MSRLSLSLLLSLFFLIPLNGQQVREITIENANSSEYDATMGTGAIRLLGDVRFSHENNVLTCDSAHYYSEDNIVDAFSNVHIIQGDTLHLYGNYLKYNGNTKTSDVRKNVVLIDKETVLKTDYLDFNLNQNFGYYTNGGNIQNGQNNLTSRQGFYYSRSKMFFFKDSVRIVNPDYTIYSDTMKYATDTEISYFLGPTEIISDSNYIYCENGWYDTRRNISQFNKNAVFKNNNQVLKGDSLYYERETGIGKAFRNVSLYDSTQRVLLLGNYAYYEEKTDYALLTDSAVFIQIEEEDSLFVHADTLKSLQDSTGHNKLLKAYFHVKYYRDDFQGKCDSMIYQESDSLFKLFHEPVLWSEDNQMTAEYIEIQMANQQVSEIRMFNIAMIVSRDDSLQFNQIRGKKMTGYASNNELKRIHVTGNSQTIYFARDEEYLIGINRAESTDLVIYLKDKKIDKLVYLVKPDAIMYPPDKVNMDELYLKNFQWLESYRPLNKKEIFIWKKQEGDIIPERPNTRLR